MGCDVEFQVATKGGLFKFHGEKLTTLWERKNAFPKKMAAFPQVVCYNDTVSKQRCSFFYSFR